MRLARLCARARARRLVVGERAARRARPQRARAGGRATPRSRRRRHRPGAATPFALRVPAEARRFDRARSASGSCSSFPSAASPPQGAILDLRSRRRRSARRRGRLRRARLAGAPRRPRRPPRRRLARSSAGAAGSAASPTGSARCRARDRPRARRRAARGARGDRARRGRGAVGRAARRLPGVGPLPPAGGLGPERRLHRGRRARARVAARGSARLAAEVAALGAIARLRARGRLAAVGRARRGRRRARLARLARSRGRATAGTSCSRGGRAARLDAGLACSSRASSSRSPRSARSSSLVPRLRLALEGYPLPRWLATRSPSPTACGAATAPILWLQFGSRPALLAAGERARRAGGRAAARPRRSSARSSSRSLPSAALALAWVNGWLAAYLAGVRAARRRAAVRPDRLGQAVACCSEQPRCPARRSQRCRAGGVRRLLACAADRRPGPRRLAAAARPTPLPPPHGPSDHVPRRRPGRRDPLQVPRAACSSTRGRPRRTSRSSCATLGVRAAGRGRSHPSAARPRRRRGGRPRRLAVDRVLDPRLTGRARYERAALAEAEKRGVELVDARAGDAFRLGRLRLRVLWPDRPGHAGRGPEPLRGRPARHLRRDRRAADRRRRDRRDGSAARHGRSRSSRSRITAPPTTGLDERAARAPAGGRRHLVRPRQRLRPPAPGDARRAAGAARGSASTGPTRTGASWSSPTASGSVSARGVE